MRSFLPFLLSLCCSPALLCAGEVSAWGIASSASGARDMPGWMPRMKEAGAGVVRLFPGWNGIEPARGEWRWESADAVTRHAAAAGLEVNGILMGSVPWRKEGTHTFPMSDLAAWSGFVEQTVSHCRTVQHWEVWNEGNGGFNDGKHTTTDYARLSAAAYAAAKRGNPAAKVAMTTASFDPAYLGRAIAVQKADGGPTAFDFLCVHPYEIADGIGRPYGDVPYLWMSRQMGQMLEQYAPEKAGAELWITEIGRNVAHRKDQPAAEREAAAMLIKAYTMAFAQGIRSVQWFEGRDPMGEEAGFGLLRRDGSERLTFQAFRGLAAALGKTPRPAGWLNLKDTLGFVFENEGTPVLVLWKDAGAAAVEIPFDSPVEVTALLDGKTMSTATVTSANEPQLIRGIPAALTAQAKANAAKPFPWGGNYAGAKSVSITLGNQEAPAGVFLATAPVQPRVSFPDGSTGLLLSANEGIRFFVHPSFASLRQQEYFVRLTVRRITPGNVGMNLHYEIADTQGRAPVRNAGTWFGLNDSTGWQTWTWHVKDACFAKMWGYDFAFVPEQSQPFVIGKVEVSTEPFSSR